MAMLRQAAKSNSLISIHADMRKTSIAAIAYIVIATIKNSSQLGRSLRLFFMSPATIKNTDAMVMSDKMARALGVITFRAKDYIATHIQG